MNNGNNPSSIGNVVVESTDTHLGKFDSKLCKAADSFLCAKKSKTKAEQKIFPRVHATLDLPSFFSLQSLFYNLKLC